MRTCDRCGRKEQVLTSAEGWCLRCFTRDLLGRRNPELAESLREHWAQLDERDSGIIIPEGER